MTCRTEVIAYETRDQRALFVALLLAVGVEAIKLLRCQDDRDFGVFPIHSFVEKYTAIVRTSHDSYALLPTMDAIKNLEIRRETLCGS